MSFPTKNTRHVEEARALLISQFRGKEVIQGFLDSYVRRLQEVENVFWDILQKRILADAIGVHLAKRFESLVNRDCCRQTSLPISVFCVETTLHGI
jgi:hypothetical protein